MLSPEPEVIKTFNNLCLPIFGHLFNKSANQRWQVPLCVFVLLHIIGQLRWVLEQKVAFSLAVQTFSTLQNIDRVEVIQHVLEINGNHGCNCPDLGLEQDCSIEEIEPSLVSPPLEERQKPRRMKSKNRALFVCEIFGES